MTANTPSLLVETWRPGASRPALNNSAEWEDRRVVVKVTAEDGSFAAARHLWMRTAHRMALAALGRNPGGPGPVPCPPHATTRRKAP